MLCLYNRPAGYKYKAYAIDELSYSAGLLRCTLFPPPAMHHHGRYSVLEQSSNLAGMNIVTISDSYVHKPEPDLAQLFGFTHAVKFSILPFTLFLELNLLSLLIFTFATFSLTYSHAKEERKLSMQATRVGLRIG